MKLRRTLMDHVLLAGYCGLTSAVSPLGESMRTAHKATAPILVLFYHRIADDAATPWTHSFRLFRRQIRWLKKHCELISLEEAQCRIRRGNNDRIAASITFDDGYADNCDRALPLLIAEKIPCTYFVSLRNVLKGKPFPHDLRRGASCRPNTVAQLCWMAQQGIEIGAHTRTHADLGRITDECKLYDEVVVAGEELQSAIGSPVRYFSFPFGLPQNLNRRAFQMAYRVRLRSAFARPMAITTFPATIRFICGASTWKTWRGCGTGARSIRERFIPRTRSTIICRRRLANSKAPPTGRE